ncbi:MAG: RNA-binding protein [Methylocella sp.]|nr:MAG: RNA-binding protein [Hyphomicrobiales bacterium]
MARSARLDPEGSPERTCIVTRAKGLPQDMIRFVAGPGAIVVPDIGRKLPGRGVWVTARACHVAEAVKRQAFSRGFRTKVVASENMAAEIEALLTKDCLQALSLACKAGQIVRGFAKVEEAIAAGAIAGLVHASDSGADGMRKLGQCLRRRFGDERARPRVELFASGQLDLALGRANVIHAAMIEGPASEGFLQRCRKLTLYRSGSPEAESPDRPSGPESNGELNSLPTFRRADTEWAGTQD